LSIGLTVKIQEDQLISHDTTKSS